MRTAAVIAILASVTAPASAQERVTVGTMRATANGALFLAAAQGYFKAEGLDLAMTAYASDQAVAEALAGGATDFGLAGFTAAAFNFAGRGTIKAIAAQVREKRDYEGNEIVVSNAAYLRGMRKPEDLAGKSVAIGHLGSPFHYQLGQAARVKRFDLATVTLKPQASIDAMVRAVANNEVDAAIVPGQQARDMLTANQAKLIAWYSELDEQQLGALFVSAKVLQTRRPTVEKFLRAYRRGAAEYATAFMRHDRYGKRRSGPEAQAAAAAIARYVYPGNQKGAATVEANAYFMDPRARLDTADVVRQVEWYQAQGLVDKNFDARGIVDVSFSTP